MVGYPRRKPGRPSHTSPSFMVANLRLIMDGEVGPGNRHHAKSLMPTLWSLLDRLGRDHWPAPLRGDSDWRSEPVMQRAEAEGLDYLFKLRLTAKTRRPIEPLMVQSAWVNAGYGREDKESVLQLTGWTAKQRVVVLRRRLARDVAIVDG